MIAPEFRLTHLRSELVSTADKVGETASNSLSEKGRTAHDPGFQRVVVANHHHCLMSAWNSGTLSGSDQTSPLVLLVDDEDAITTTLAPYLERSGFRVEVANNGVDALAAHQELQPDIVVSDVMMPGMNGRELVRRLRSNATWTPVILLTKVDASFERAAALDEGADDYVGKPFDPPELVSRIRAVLRRTAAGRPLTSREVLTSGGLQLDRTTRRVHLNGKAVDLTPKAVVLLDYLMTHPTEIHTREHLLAELWGFEFAVSTRAVDHRIAELRRKLHDNAAEPKWIETVPGAGYRFSAGVAG